MSLGGIVTGLGWAIVTRGLGGGQTGTDTDCAATIRIPAAPGRWHIGDTVALEDVLVRDLDDELVDPATLTVIVRPENSSRFTLVYGSAATSGGGDAIVRTATGTFTIQIAITQARGTGLYQFSIVTTGARAAEDGQFRVLSRPM